ncbi:IS1182 family transposase [Saccharopolyspora hattusasensis]|uniref:IS1182 family transposase n=1 Tax=Saccharopolyspora hattusasensis TaxID=1128679 RepID=UPI003D951C6D
MQPRPWPRIPEATVRAARAAAGTSEYPLAMRVRDELGELFSDAEFIEAFGVRGKPGWSPGRLALVTVLQMAENLTDRGAAHRVRFGMDWKYALGMELDDPGFDASVLSEFRTRLVAHGLEERALDLLLKVLQDKGLVAAGGKQRTDSTHVVAAVRDLNRLELAGESVRAALEALAAAVPQWLAEAIDVPAWGQRYAARVDSWRLPTSETKRRDLAVTYGTDGYALLGAVYSPNAPGWLRELPAVEVLRVVLLQNYTRTITGNGREVITRREADTDGLPPGRSRLTSPYDTDARWGGKRDTFWNGYKVHFSETCRRPSTQPEPEPEPADATVSRPNLITNVATTDASVPDVAMTEPIHQALDRRGLLPGEHYLDSGYPSAELIVSSVTDFGVTLITPVLADHSPQARAGAGFDRTRFTIDFDREQATCPQGQTSSTWNPATQRGTDTIVITFATATCGPCPVREQCTTSRTRRRQITVHPRAVHEAQRAARADQETKDWQAEYALRAGVEGTIRQGIAVTDLRHARYRGLAKTHLQHVFSAVALNLIRLDAWWNGHPLDRTRTSHLTRLEHALAA